MSGPSDMPVPILVWAASSSLLLFFWEFLKVCARFVLIDLGFGSILDIQVRSRDLLLQIA